MTQKKKETGTKTAAKPKRKIEHKPRPPKKKWRKKKDKRVCLRCQKDFLSEGIHNRICSNCNKTNDNSYDPKPHSAYFPGSDSPLILQ